LEAGAVGAPSSWFACSAAIRGVHRRPRHPSVAHGATQV